MTSKQLFTAFAVIALGIFTISSCVKKKFDAPPNSDTVDPKIPVTHTILDLKKKFTGTATKITEDITIYGIVTADDKTGGFYKNMIIQDSTSGIQVNIAKAGLAGEYPIGRKIYIKCKGLYMGAYGGFIQLGYTPDNTNAISDIPWSIISDFIVKANTGNKVEPKQVTIPQLKALLNSVDATKWMGTLIQIDSAEFLASEVGNVYAQDPAIASGTDRKIADCSNTQIVIRMSGYASYRNTLLPSGKGPVTAIFSRYNSTPQLLIRDTTDLPLRGTRCGGVVIVPAVDVTIDSLRKMHNQNASVSAKAYKIHGTIISSRLDSSISKGNIFIQDESGRGMLVYFGQNEVNKMIGDSVTIELDSLVTYAGVMEAKANLAKMVVISGGHSVTPKLITLADLNADLSQTTLKDRKYESTLVQIDNCTITGTPATYSGPNIADRSKTVTDPTSTIVMYSQGTVPFKTTTYPTVPVIITAVASKFNTTNQIQIRKFSDVTIK
jgi:hypothetical protein